MKRRAEGMKLKWKMLAVIFTGLLPMLLAVTVLFLQTRNSMVEKHLENVSEQAEKISQNIDEMLWNIYAVSDKFAYDKDLAPYMSYIYEEEAAAYKQKDVLSILNRIFAKYDLLRENEKISAIYTYKGELFNFLDIANDGPDVIEKLEALDINGREKLMMFVWYPLMDNFLKREQTGEIRKDKMILGSRRVFNQEKSLYSHIHIFAVPEEDLFEKYRGAVETTDTKICILDGKGNLLSSSEEKLLQAGQIPTELKEAVFSREEDEFELTGREETYRVYVAESKVNDWLSVMAVPLRSVTGAVDALYKKIFLVVAVCMVFCSLMILLFYRNFMKPVAALNWAMQAVNKGNLDAYVKVSRRDEMGKMMEHYNDMLRSINTHVVEKLNNERRKKELEMEVLVSQINPHFLYNTLENIVWKSNEAERPDIGRLAASLGRMYRLSASGEQIIRMQREIEHLMAYVKIQKNRYGDKFEFELATDVEEVRNWYTPKLLLQPVVENSFLYGMEGLDRTLYIRMDMKIRRDWLEVRILDNGAGMGKERLLTVRRQILFGKTDTTEHDNHRSTGIGLHNVEARMELYFNVNNALRIYSREGKGTLTVIKIPKITKEFLEKWSNGQK